MTAPTLDCCGTTYDPDGDSTEQGIVSDWESATVQHSAAWGEAQIDACRRVLSEQGRCTSALRYGLCGAAPSLAGSRRYERACLDCALEAREQARDDAALARAEDR